jgi:glycosyltransferase involved in cell wall biosynthesis
MSSALNRPLVSIVIPSYNSANYIVEAVESALAQDYSSIEVIVIDDGSTDATKEVLEPYITANKITYIHQENKGVSAARNAGIHTAKGMYIAFLDSDDIFYKEKIRLQVEALEAHPEYAVCYSDILHFTDSIPREYYHHTYHYPSGDIFAALLKAQFINPLGVLLRKQILDQFGYFNEALRTSEDWELWLRLAHGEAKFLYLDKVLAEYRMRVGGNLTSLEKEPTMKKQNIGIFTELGKSLSEEEKKKYQFSDIMQSLHMKAMVADLLVGQKQEAVGYTNSFTKRFIIRIVPAFVWQWTLTVMRKLRHASLLEKIENPHAHS